MKKVLAGILTALVVFSLLPSAFAADALRKEAGAAYTVAVNDQILDLRDLPSSPYAEGGTVMVPLRRIGEALGYKVDWDPETAAITVDDGYIQSATLFNKTAAVSFAGHLQVIDMSREIENAVETTILDGCTYVPAEFFKEFLNDVAIEGTVIAISPSRSELHSTGPCFSNG